MKKSYITPAVEVDKLECVSLMETSPSVPIDNGYGTFDAREDVGKGLWDD